MNKKLIIAFVGGLLFIGLILWLLDGPGSNGGVKKSYYANWDTTYGIESPDPQNTGFFNELLKAHIKDSVHIAFESDDLDSIKGIEQATYMFIGKELALLPEEFTSLMEKVDKGATLFLSFDLPDSSVYHTYFDENAYYWEYSDRTWVALGDTSLSYCSVFQNDTIHSNWYTFNSKSIRDTNYQAIAFSMYEPVSFVSKHGKGKVVLHSMPQLFKNYQVLQPNGFSHAEFMMRQIPKNMPVVWLEFASYKEYEGDDPDNTGEKEDRSFLKFIMDNESLRWAFFLALFVFLLYVFFRAKRRLAILPGIPEKRNMSLAFVDTLSSIYLSRNSPYGVMTVLRKNFYTSVNRFFYVDLVHAKTQEQVEKREESIQRLLSKSNFDEQELRYIINKLDTTALKSQQITEAELGKVYRSIRAFYKATGIMRESESFVTGDKEVIVHRSLLTGGITTLVGMTVLLRAIYLLAAGNGMGSALLIGGIAILFVGIRFITLPVARISSKAITVYRPFIGKLQLDLADDIAYTTSRTATNFFTQSGEEITIKHALLSRRGIHALRLFTEHLKQKAS